MTEVLYLNSNITRKLVMPSLTVGTLTRVGNITEVVPCNSIVSNGLMLFSRIHKKLFFISPMEQEDGRG